MSALESFISLCKSAPERFKTSFTDFMSAEIRGGFFKYFWLSYIAKFSQFLILIYLRFICAAFLHGGQATLTLNAATQAVKLFGKLLLKHGQNPTLLLAPRTPL